MLAGSLSASPRQVVSSFKSRQQCGASSLSAAAPPPARQHRRAGRRAMHVACRASPKGFNMSEAEMYRSVKAGSDAPAAPQGRPWFITVPAVLVGVLAATRLAGFAIRKLKNSGCVACCGCTRRGGGSCIGAC